MSQTAKTFSPFWPIQIMTTCFLGWVVFQVYIINNQRLSLNDRLDDVQNQLESAEVGEKRMMSLQQDLLNLAQKGDPNAMAIIKKHNLFVLGRGGNPNGEPNSPPPGQGQ